MLLGKLHHERLDFAKAVTRHAREQVVLGLELEASIEPVCLPGGVDVSRHRWLHFLPLLLRKLEAYLDVTICVLENSCNSSYCSSNWNLSMAQ